MGKVRCPRCERVLEEKPGNWVTYGPLCDFCIRSDRDKADRQRENEQYLRAQEKMLRSVERDRSDSGGGSYSSGSSSSSGGIVGAISSCISSIFAFIFFLFFISCCCGTCIGGKKSDTSLAPVHQPDRVVFTTGG
jgi:hypothetical protein